MSHEMALSICPTEHEGPPWPRGMADDQFGWPMQLVAHSFPSFGEWSRATPYIRDQSSRGPVCHLFLLRCFMHICLCVGFPMISRQCNEYPRFHRDEL